MQDFLLQGAVVSDAVFPLQLSYKVLIIHGHTTTPAVHAGGQNAHRGHVRG